jgi:hypothetical protein
MVSFYHIWLNQKQLGMIKSGPNMGSMSYGVVFKNTVVINFTEKWESCLLSHTHILNIMQPLFPKLYLTCKISEKYYSQILHTTTFRHKFLVKKLHNRKHNKWIQEGISKSHSSAEKQEQWSAYTFLSHSIVNWWQSNFTKLVNIKQLMKSERLKYQLTHR